MNQAFGRLSRRNFLYFAGGMLGTSLFLANCSTNSSRPLMDEVSDRGKLIIGTDAGYEPFTFIEDGQIVGYDPDILALVVNELGVQLEMQELPFEGLLPALMSQKVDLVAAGFKITPERAQKFAFHLPVAVDGTALMKRKGDERIETLEDLSGKVVGVLIDSNSATAIAEFDAELKASGQDGIGQIKEFKSNAEEYLALSNGQIDAVTAGQINLAEVISKRPDEYELLGSIGERNFVGWMVRPENKAFRDVLNQALQKLFESGDLARLQEKWFGFTMDLPTTGYLPAGAH